MIINGIEANVPMRSERTKIPFGLIVHGLCYLQVLYRPSEENKSNQSIKAVQLI